jgi:hypothetical protein
MTFKKNSFDPRKLTLITPRVPLGPGERPLGIGDHAQLNSGGPRALVVDVFEDRIVVALPGGSEAEFPRECLHRVP